MKVVAVIFALILAGCASQSPTDESSMVVGNPINFADVDKLVHFQSTKQDVLNLLGEPSAVIQKSENVEFLEYHYKEAGETYWSSVSIEMQFGKVTGVVRGLSKETQLNRVK